MAARTCRCFTRLTNSKRRLACQGHGAECDAMNLPWILPKCSVATPTSSSNQGQLRRGLFGVHDEARHELLRAGSSHADELCVSNGFFVTVRSAVNEPSKSIRYYMVEWDSAKAQFRGFPRQGLRPNVILCKWKKLGLGGEPTVGDTDVHASAPFFEGVAEHLNWHVKWLLQGIAERWHQGELFFV